MRVEPEGPAPCDLMLLGEAPGYEEQQFGRPFVGRVGQELWSGMRRHAQLSRDDFYLTNVVKTGLAKGKSPKPADIGQALPELLDEIEAVQPRVIVTAGAIATRVILGPRSLHDVHGVPHTVEVAGHSCVCLPIYHPASGLGNKGMLAPFAWDLGRLRGLLRGDVPVWAPTPLPVTRTWLTQAGMRALEGRKARHVALDTEGWATAPKMVSFSPDGVTGYVIRASDTAALAWLWRWLDGRTPVLHNGLHDIPVLRALGYEIGPFEDTQVLAYHDLLRTGSGTLDGEAQNLGTTAYRECQLELGELRDLPGVDFTTRTIPDSPSVMAYAALDAIATYRLFLTYVKRGLLDYPPYRIDMGQVGLIEEMQRTGLPFDADGVLDYYVDILDKLEAAKAALKAKAARYGMRDFNPGSHPQVRELVTRKIGLRVRKRTRGGQASTNEKALADFAENEVVQLLQTFREIDKVRGTYVRPLLEALQGDPDDDDTEPVCEPA